MAKYGGFFLKGVASGLQGLGTQVAEMTWQKREKERIQKEKDNLAETVSIFNKKIEDYYADGTLSDDEKLQLHTAYLASAYNVQEVIQGTYEAVMKMDKDTTEQNFAYIKSYIEQIGDMDPSSITGLYEFTKSQMIGEKGKQMLRAGDSLLKKRYEAQQKQQPEVYTSPGELLKVHPGSSWTYSADAGGYIPTFQKPEVPEEVGLPDYNTAVNYLKNIINVSPENWEIARKGLENKYGLDLSGITQESLREPEQPAGGIEPETVSTLKNWEDMFNIKSETGPRTEEEYNRALDLLSQSKDKYTPKYASWKEALISEVKGIGEELKGTTNKADYDLLLNIYMQKLEEIKAKYPEVNLSQFPTFEKEKRWFQKLIERGKYSK